MKLLFDQNLSPKLPARVADIFPGSDHVLPLGLDTAPDQQVWDFARANDFVIVSKDADYPNLVALRGHPPKVVWLQLGNCTTQQVEDALRVNHVAIESLGNDPSVGTIAIQ
jgi:predicted nuclease of predicted toxin-antitoxin system